MWEFERFLDNTALTEETGLQLTYAELQQENEKLASAIKHRCLVFILCTNTVGAVVGYTACIRHRVVPLLLAADLDNELLKNLVKTYKPDYLWAPSEQILPLEEGREAYTAFGYSLYKTGYEAEYELNDGLCLLLTTSGSTGSPKLVRQSYENVFSNACSIAEYLELDDTERPITTLPMNYTYGLSIINSHLLVGACVLLTEKGLMQKGFWEFFREAKATSFGGVPYTYEMLDKLRFSRMKLPSLRTMTQAGGKLQPELHKKFAQFAIDTGRRFYVMYGQAEATARMSYLPYQMSLEKYGSMGIAIPGGKFSLIDIEGKEITEADTTGELVYEGPNVTWGYAECGEDLNKGDERKGRLVTGDMAQRDKEGYYYIVGRKKRFLKIFGNRVNLDEVDRLVKDHFPALDCASAGVDDKMYLFLTKEGYSDEVHRFISEKTGLNSSAFTVRVLSEIPRNDAGKILYNELTKYFD